MLRVLGIALCVLFCSVLLREQHRAFAVMLSVAGTLLLLLSVVGELTGVVSGVQKLVQGSELSLSYMKMMLKALGITLMTQTVSDLCRDNGENALATATETVAKIAIVAMLMPLLESIISVVGDLLK